jgi:prepilin-type processing-associated H-X9-DG protein
MSRGIIKVIFLGIPVLLLLGMLVYGITRFREMANRARCQDNLRKIGLFGLSEMSEREFVPGKPDSDRSYPAATIVNANLKPDQRLSWMVTVLPSLGKDDVYKQFDLMKGWADDANHDAICALIPTFACPSHYVVPAPGTAQLNPYVGIAGIGIDAPTLPATDPRAGVFRYDEPTKFGMLVRGLSHTIIIMETERDPGPWAAGGNPTARGLIPSDEPFIGPGRQFGGHPGGCNSAYADGSVRFQSASIGPTVLEVQIPLGEYTIPE